MDVDLIPVGEKGQLFKLVYDGVVFGLLTIFNDRSFIGYDYHEGGVVHFKLWGDDMVTVIEAVMDSAISKGVVNGGV